MGSTLRLHVFPPEDEEGILPPTSSDDLDRYAVEEMFLNYFPPSSHASLRHDDAEIVSQIFEDREDNLQRVAELVSELEDLYPEADILRTRKDVTDAMGAEWEYNEDILVIVANLNIQSSPINWQFNKDVYGKQLTPPGCVSEGRLALTDGRNLWGLSTTTGDQIWSVDLPNRANRTPILVGQTIVVETGEAHRGYDTESGECLWVVGDLPTTTTTRHISRAQSCYFGDFEGTIWELKENGDWMSICSLDERIISVHVDESHVYALKRGPDQSGTTPETIHAIRKETGQIGWTHTPNGTLRSHLTSSADHLFVSTRERLIALDVESGTVAWRNPVPSSEPDNEEVESEDSNRFSTDPDDDGSDNSLSANIDWDTDFQYESESINRISLSSKPIFEEDLFAPTTRGLLRITSTSGEIEWEALSDTPSGFSPPTHDKDHIYIGSKNTVYAIRKSDGEIAWQFETPGSPGSMTYCDSSESLTFITHGLAINVQTSDPTE